MKLSELKALKQFDVIKTFTGKYHADNHDELKADIIETLKVNGISSSELTENGYGFNFGSRTWMKPKIPKISYGKIVMRSKDYIFYKDDGTKSYGSELKSENMLSDGFQVDTFDGNKIIYTILK